MDQSEMSKANEMNKACAKRSFSKFDPALSRVEKLKRCAEMGDADSQCKLGHCYEDGDGVEQNYEEAVRWYRKAAEQESPEGQYYWGLCYETEKGVEENTSVAWDLFRRAAEQGYVDAQYIYALINWTRGNFGVDVENSEWYRWMRKAAIQGDVHSKANIADGYDILLENEDDVLQRQHHLTKAVAWRRLAAEQGDTVSQLMLGDCYFEGKGVEQDDAEAEQWYRLALAAENKRGKDGLEKIQLKRDKMAKSKEESEKKNEESTKNAE